MSVLAKKTIKNSIYSMAAFGWPIIISFFVTPFIVHKLGQEYYGILALVASSIGFLSFTDFGMTPALVKYIVQYNVEKDYSALNRLFSTAQTFFIIVGVLSGILIAVFGWNFAPNMFKVSPGATRTLQVVFVLSAIGFLLQMIIQSLVVIPGALQRFDLTSKVNIALATFSTVATIFVLTKGRGVIAISLIGLVLSAVAIVTYYFIARRLIPKLKIFRLAIYKDFTKRIFLFGGYASVAALATTILFELDKIIIGAQLGPSSVTYYVLPGNLAIKVHTAMLALLNVLFPLSAELIASGDIEKLKTIYVRATRAMMTVLILAVIPAILFASPFLYYWLGPDFAQKSSIVLQLLLVTYSLLALTIIPFGITYAMGKPKYAAIFSIMMGAINITMLYVLIPKYQINGAALAYLIAVVPAVAYLLFVEKKLLGLRSVLIYKGMIPRLALIAILVSSVSLYARQHIHSLARFIIVYLLTVTVSVILSYVLKLYNDEDIAMVKSMFKRKA